MKFADHLAQRGLSQEAAAKELGITQGRVSQLVKGGRPGWKLTARIKDWSGGRVTPDDWLSDDCVAEAAQ